MGNDPHQLLHQAADQATIAIALANEHTEVEVIGVVITALIARRDDRAIALFTHTVEPG